MLTLLLGTNWKQNRHEILLQVTNQVAAGREETVLMVPELISHQTERDLCSYAGDTASRYAEVLSFSRLAKQVAEESGHGLMECLDNGGRIVAMAAATRQLHSKLKAYAPVETKPEFLLSLLDAVDEFKRCCITADDLLDASSKTEGSLAQKLEELSLILQAYNAICARGKRDPRDQMTWLLELLSDCDYAQNHTFFFHGFPSFSRQHLEILCHLISNSPNVTVSLNCDRPGSDAMAFEEAGATAADLIAYAIRNEVAYEIVYAEPDDGALQLVADRILQGELPEGAASDCLHVYQSETPYDACSFIAEQITELIRNGCRYRDMRVVCTDLQSFQRPVLSVFERAHIPVYLSGTEDILEKTVIHTVLSAMDAAIGGLTQKDVLRYLKSMLSPVELRVCDKIENYAVLWSIDGTRWLNPWENHPRGLGEVFSEYDEQQLQFLNSAREMAVAPLAELRDGFRTAVGVRQQVQVLYGFLEKIGLQKRLQKLASDMDAKGDYRNAQILNQLWDILICALEQLYDVLGDTAWDADTFTRLLKLLLSQYDVGTIPSVLDAVAVGSVSALRCQSSAHLFVLGASEGCFPAYGTSAGVLNDQERAELQKLGMAINAGAIEGLQTQFSEIQEVFCGAEESVSVFCTDGQPSFIYNRLKVLAGHEEIAVPQYGCALTDSMEAAAYLIGNEMEEEARQIGLKEEVNQIIDSREHALGSVSPAHVEALYGTKLNLSASQIDRVSECRLSYFLKYGIRAKERKPASVDPAEFGTYVHAVLEECGRKIVTMGGFRNVSLETTLVLAADASAKYFAERFAQIGTQRMQYHFRKNAQEVKSIVTELWKEMQESSFDAVRFELSFGDGGEMPAIAIPGRKLDAQLRGFVDRVDCWNHNGIPYVRVVDYKTGKKDFDYCDVFNGIGLQMMLYLYALEEGGEEIFGTTPVAAGVQYFPARVPLVAADGAVSQEEAEELHTKELKRKGLLLNDEQVLYAVEQRDDPKRIPVKRKKDGTITGDLASSHQFAMLKKYIYGLLSDIVDEIASGNVTPNPYTRGASHNACRFCPYGAVCHPNSVPDRRNYQAMSADRFWEEIEKEVGQNG